MDKDNNIISLEEFRLSHIDRIKGLNDPNIEGISRIQNYIIGGFNEPTELHEEDAKKALNDLNDTSILNDNRALFRYARIANFFIQDGRRIFESIEEDDEIVDITSQMGRAACRGLDNRLFFSDNEKIIDESVKICNQCEIKNDCLQRAIDNNEKYGVWGGVPAKIRNQKNN